MYIHNLICVQVPKKLQLAKKNMYYFFFPVLAE